MREKRELAFMSAEGDMVVYPLTAEAIKQQIKAAGIHFVVALPDRVTSHYLLKGLMADPDFRVVQVCKEDEGVSVCAGLFAAGQRSLLMMQYTGLLDSVNSLRGIAVEGRSPVCMLVGLLGKEPDVAPRQSKKLGVKITEPILEALGIEHHLVENDSDVGKIAPAVEKAYADSFPTAILIGREPRQP